MNEEIEQPIEEESQLEEQEELEPVPEEQVEPEPVDLTQIETDLKAIHDLLETEFNKQPVETVIEVPTDDGEMLSAITTLNESVIWIFAVQFIIIGLLFFNLIFTSIQAGKSS